MFYSKNHFKLFICGIISVVFILGCSNTPTGGSGILNTPDVEGLLIKQNGIDVVELEEGIMRGEISLKEGETNRLFEVVFLDENGDEIDEFMTPYQMCVTNQNETCVAVEQNEALKKFAFCLHGIIAGESKLCVKLHDTDPDYPHYQSPPIPVKVKK